MDQLKAFLGLLKRQHFWFLAPILFVVGLFGWMTSTSKLSAEFETNSGIVNGYVTKMKSVSDTAQHPNEQYEEGMKSLIRERRENIRAAWELKWERQKTALKWPEELPEDFRQLVNEMRPIETTAKEIPAPHRRAYAAFVRDLLPKLAKQIGADWAPTGGRTGFSNSFSSRATEGAEVESNAVVVWNPQDQGALAAKYDWGDGLPSKFDVLYAQEDLWVLSTLIDIIAETNGDAVTRAQAAVKSIEFIQIGAEVDPPNKVGFSIISLPEFVSEDAEADGEAGEEAEPEEEIVYGDDFIASADGEMQQAAAPDYVKNRYYDANFTPIDSKESLLTSASVAKRIPVRIRVTMNQLSIENLLVNCANALLTFEVRQLRFNPKSSGMSGRYGANREMSTNSEFSVFRRNTATAKLLDDYESLVRTVELFGIVYIFNPVDANLAGAAPGEDAQLEEET